MDIQIALWELLQAAHDGDRELFEENLETLRRWHDNGGYLPEVKDAGNDAWLVRRSSGGEQ